MSAHKKFIFNENIDNGFLFTLYENDYPYVKEVFYTTLQTYDEDVSEVRKAYQTKDIQALHKAAHKLKPVFGFTGLLKHQEKVGKFENLCCRATSTEDVRDEYARLLLTLSDGRAVMEEEHKRLNEFLKAL